MARYVLVWVGLLIPLFGYGQIQRTIHNTFEVPDSVNTIAFSITGPYVVEVWPGNVLMSEIKVNLYNGSEGLLKHLLGTDRYKLACQVESQLLSVKSVATEQRSEIKTSTGALTELVDIRIFLPDSFEDRNDGIWQRKQKKEQKEDKGGA